MNNTIIIKNLSKNYRNGVKALDNIDFSITNGVFGLLGHNGAGKTTLMKTITTLLKPSKGSIEVCGFDTQSQGKDVRKHIGYLPQELSMYPNLSVWDFISYIANLKGIHDKKEVQNVLEKVDMLQYSKRKIGTLSGGMKRRVGIAQAFLGSPDILIVDEPTAGLDPEERVRFRGMLSCYARDGKIVILSTHILEDIYQVCDDLAVLRNGELFFKGSPNELIDITKNKVKVVQVKNDTELLSLQSKAVVLSSTYEKECIVVKIMDEHNLYPNISSIEATLEDAYIYCMGGKQNE